MTVDLMNDTTVEGDEEFFLTVTIATTTSEPSSSSVLITIQDNDSMSVLIVCEIDKSIMMTENQLRMC